MRKSSVSAASLCSFDLPSRLVCSTGIMGIIAAANSDSRSLNNWLNVD